MNILITSISRKVLLVKQFKRVATNFSDVTIFTGDVDSDAVGLMYSDKHLILPKDKDLVMPLAGIGTGRALLKQNAPKTWSYLQQELGKLRKNYEQSY